MTEDATRCNLRIRLGNSWESWLGTVELGELRGTRVVETHRLIQIETGGHLSGLMTFVLEQARCFTLVASKHWNQRECDA